MWEKVKKSVGLAYELEKEFDKVSNENGARRYFWIFPSDIQSEYKEDKNWMHIQFFLPKGSYATELIAELIH